MIETDILTALQKGGIAAINTTVVAPAQPLPIKAIGRVLDKPDALRYFEFISIPNNRIGDYWGNERTYQGIFRILLHWTIDDQGAYPPLHLLDTVANYFTKETRFRSGEADVQIYGEPDLGGIITSNAELIYPLSLRYRDFRP
jgi:hypothetical protein